MASGRSLLRLVPEEADEETVVVSKKKLDRLLKEKDEEIARWRKEAEELRRKLRTHENPNVPPSVRNQAPGYARLRPLKSPEDRRKPGGQPGHEGVTRDPLPADERIALTAKECRKCRSLRLQLKGTETKQEIEIERRRKVTEVTQAIYGCLDCGEETRATLPGGREPSGYGPQLQADIVLGKIEERLPYRKLEERLARDGIPSCPATLQAVLWGASERLTAEETAILARIRAAPTVYADESIFRVDGAKWWIWTFSTPQDTLLVIRPSRGEGVVREILGEGFRGKVIVCDGHGAYPHPEKGWVLQRCWAHLLRMARAAEEAEPRGELLYEELAGLYRDLTAMLKKDGRTAARRRWHRIGSRELGRLLRRYEASRWRAHRKVGVYLRNGGSSWLTFLRRPGVEPTNNRGERALREAIVIRKIIGTLRNARGAQVFARLMSVIGTWKLRGENPAAKLYAALS
jgi:transposase